MFKKRSSGADEDTAHRIDTPPDIHSMFNAILSLTLLASTALTPVWSQADYSPISDEAYTEDLEIAGIRNGYMPTTRLMDVAGCTLDRDAAYTLALMIEAAAEDGVGLYPGDCYRTFAQQQSAWEARCPIVKHDITTVDAETGESVVVGRTSERECTGAPIAPAGKSNHGWGRATDFTSSGRSTLDCNDSAFTWLNANAAQFGWVHPDWATCGLSTAEPWHWEWGGVQYALPLRPVAVTVREGILEHVR